ncbi:hypothetical protein NN561_008795 [Cricetulus griseus]
MFFRTEFPGDYRGISFAVKGSPGSKYQVTVDQKKRSHGSVIREQNGPHSFGQLNLRPQRHNLCTRRRKGSLGFSVSLGDNTQTRSRPGLVTENGSQTC